MKENAGPPGMGAVRTAAKCSQAGHLSRLAALKKEKEKEK